MGAVARPGVFELPCSRTPLLDLVGLAGGTTPEASGNVRVIRGGRSGWQTCLTTSPAFLLRPNDLIVVDSVSTRSGRGIAGRSWRFSAAVEDDESGASSACVQVGIVQLISRPVVMDIACDQATVKGVLALLHQPPQDQRKVTVIKPAGGIDVVDRDQPQDVHLTSGAVLIFDPAAVSAAALPQLPSTIVPEGIGTTTVALPASVPEPLTKAPSTEPIFPNGPAEPGERPQFVPRKLSANHTAPARIRSGKPRPVGESAVQHQLARLSGLLAVAAILSSVILLLWMRQKRIERVAKGAPGRISGIRSSSERAVRDAHREVGQSESLPQEPGLTEYRLQEAVHRVDAAQALSGPFVRIPPAPKRARPELDTLGRALPPGATRRKVRIDEGHLPVSTRAIDRALAALNEGRRSRS